MTPAARLRLVAGKGGVGRTTVSAALAQHACARGQRVLAIDATSSGDLARVVDELTKSKRSSAENLEAPGSVTTLTLSTVNALDHYLRVYLPLARLPGLGGGPNGAGPLARILEYVATAAPGVREILMIGKIGWETLNGGWDEVIVDAPATGHIVELLDAPRAIAELAPTGPLAEQTDWLTELLGRATTTVELVTTPQELPVSETVELLDRLDRSVSTGIGSLLVNRVPLPLGPAARREAAELADGDDPLADAVRHVVDCRDRAEVQIARLTELLGTSMPSTNLEILDSSAPVGAVLNVLDQSGWS